MNENSRIPIYVAIASGIFSSFVAVITVGTTVFLNLRQNKANAVGQEKKNFKQDIENADFGNEFLKRAAMGMEPLLENYKKARIANNRLESDLEIAKYEAAKAKGAEESALKQRANLYDEVETLRGDVARLTQQVAVLTKVITDANLTIPA